MCKCPTNFGKLVQMSFGFTILFTAYITSQALATKVLKDNDFGNLGFYSLGVLYFVFGCSSFITAPIVRKLGDKKALSIGAICYAFYTGSFIIPLMRSEYPENEML
jgi:hypothetical protein